MLRAKYRVRILENGVANTRTFATLPFHMQRGITMGKPILCVDFDGVIHSYDSGWQGADVVSDPLVPGAIAFLLSALERFDVCIYSSRTSQPGGLKAMKDYLQREAGQTWYDSPAGSGLENVRFPEQKPAAFLTLDDRAVCFDGRWPSVEALALFKPWNKR